MSGVSDTARLLGLLTQPKTQGPNQMRLGTEEWVDNERSALDCLLGTHFSQHETAIVKQHELGDWELMRRIYAVDRVR